MASSETLRRRSGRRRLAGRRALAASPGGGQSKRAFRSPGPQCLPASHGDHVLFLGGFFVLTYWANTGSAAEKRLGWPSALVCEGEPRPVVLVGGVHPAPRELWCSACISHEGHSLVTFDFFTPPSHLFVLHLCFLSLDGGSKSIVKYCDEHFSF